MLKHWNSKMIGTNSWSHMNFLLVRHLKTRVELSNEKTIGSILISIRHILIRLSDGLFFNFRSSIQTIRTCSEKDSNSTFVSFLKELANIFEIQYRNIILYQLKRSGWKCAMKRLSSFMWLLLYMWYILL